MKLTVEPEVFEAFPGMRLVVAVAYGVDNTKAPSLSRERIKNPPLPRGRSY